MMKVTEKQTAIAMGSGDLPVLATPAMVALMENAAMKESETLCKTGETTVGISINIKHSRATPVGESISCVATLINQDGGRLLFRVQASDSKGEIGKGEHERFIVNRERFMARL